MFKYIKPAFLCIMIMTISLLSSCQKKVNTANRTEEVLGTIITGTIYGTQNEDQLMTALDAAFDRATELEAIFSAKLPDSELTIVNESAFSAPVKISKELYTVLESSLYYATLTGGAFDPTLGNLIGLWGIGTENAAVPDSESLEAYINQRNYENVVLDKNEQTVFFTSDDFSLDLGAIAKGYVADEMKRILEENYDITSALLNLGGNVITIGSKTDGSPWNIGIANPDEPTSSITTISITNQTVVTSGNYERYFEEDGIRYHHILDAATGYPADNGLISSTIITDSSIDADALSTATFVMGLDASMELIEALDNVEAIFITDEGKILSTEGLSFR